MPTFLACSAVLVTACGASGTTSSHLTPKSATGLIFHGELLGPQLFIDGDPGPNKVCANDGDLLELIGDNGSVVGAEKLTGVIPDAQMICTYPISIHVATSMTYKAVLNSALSGPLLGNNEYIASDLGKDQQLFVSPKS